ncbi:Hypothetical predicted protein [Octopus vulgaris]|uniref:HTH CENPB-type domain-containing protein n=1 Tax=Octopus vulgaris TaxID=6645 RepID=A0AA36AV40_OCTVU|nr:Hypothetical predicted protein [Octopus vulgaris]
MSSPCQQIKEVENDMWLKSQFLPMFDLDLQLSWCDKRKSERATLPQNVIQQAIQQVRARVISLHEDSRTIGIYLKSLFPYCTKAAEANNDHSLCGYKKPRQVLTDEFENHLEAYVLAAAEIYYGLAPKDVRKLAFQMAKAHGCNIPPTWHETEMAGEDWFSGYLQRHKNLSIRSPQATSLARAASFNKTNVAMFFNQLAEVMLRDKFDPFNIYNMDETGKTTVQRPDIIIARKETKQVGKMTSAGRGTLVTLVCCVNAAGNSIPPYFVFSPEEL